MSPLRFGIMCPARGLSQFAEDCIQNIRDLATPELLILDASDPRRSSAWEKLKKSVSLNGNLWYLQNRLFPIDDIPAYRTKPIDECFPNVARLPCSVTRKGKWSEYFSPEDIDRIRDHRLDFILKFAYGIVRVRPGSVSPGDVLGRLARLVERDEPPDFLSRTGC